jgi:hypothetical protein
MLGTQLKSPGLFAGALQSVNQLRLLAGSAELRGDGGEGGLELRAKRIHDGDNDDGKPAAIRPYSSVARSTEPAATLGGGHCRYVNVTEESRITFRRCSAVNHKLI